MWIEVQHSVRILVGVLQEILRRPNRPLELPAPLWPDVSLNQGLLISCAAQVCHQDVGCSHKRMDGYLIAFVKVQGDC